METNMGWVISAIVAMGGFLAWFVRVTIQTQLAQFRETIREEFMDTKLILAKLEPIQKDIGFINGRIDEVEKYAHQNNHDLRNEITSCKLALGIRSEK